MQDCLLRQLRKHEYTPPDQEMPKDDATPFACIQGHVHSDIADDLALIQSLQDGCEKCFDVLFARYWKLVFTIAWKILRDRTDAEDIVQEVFLTIYIQRDRYESTRGSVKTWICAIRPFQGADEAALHSNQRASKS